MNQRYFRNSEHAAFWLIQPGNKVVEISIIKTGKGIYSRINEYTSTESDLNFIALTNEQITQDVFFSTLDEMFGFYQSLFHQPK